MMTTRLPPGQVALEGFPRFGAHAGGRPPRVPEHPAIAVTGDPVSPFSVPLSDLAGLPRREVTADLHCVSGWSAIDLSWEGVGFDDFYRGVIEPALNPGTAPTHLVFGGLDGFRSIVCLDDALAGTVLLAERLDGAPLGGDHGAPVRLVSPDQYGFVSVKHLSLIEVHESEPAGVYHHVQRIQMVLRLVRPHRRARVWQEERHRYLPSWLTGPVYRALVVGRHPAIRPHLPRD